MTKTQNTANKRLQGQVAKIVGGLPGKDKTYLSILGDALYIKDAAIKSKKLLIDQITAHLNQQPTILQQKWVVCICKAVEKDLRYSG